jgi:GH18 family chitinase
VNDDTGVMGPYAYGQGNWVGYDDTDTAIKKVDYIINNKIGGAIIWDISNLLF